jgi:hypothetical protein
MTPATNLEHDGIRQSITEWALDYGITPAIIIGRLERGEAISAAITAPMKVGYRGQRLPIFSAKQKQPLRRKHGGNPAKTYTHDGKTLTAQQWSHLTGIKRTTIDSRLRKGWSIDLALTVSCRRGPKPGVVFNLRPSKGTGAGSTAQETPNITFSGIDA